MLARPCLLFFQGGERCTPLGPHCSNRWFGPSFRNADYNQITSIPPQFGNLTSLQLLSLEHNQVERIPSEIGRMTSLTSVYLNDNAITNIPVTISSLVRLKQL